MFAPSAKSVVDQIAFMSPAMSSVPLVDSDLDFALLKTSLMPLRAVADADLSRADDAANSPVLAVSMALTSAAVLGIISIFKFLKSCRLSDALVNARSRD